MAYRFINIHCHQSDPSADISVISQYVSPALDLIPESSAPYKSIGLHPWHFGEDTLELQWEHLNKCLDKDSYFAIGECGLDRLKGPALEFQEKILLLHCQLAIAYSKPMILHVVRTISNLLAFRKRYPSDIPMIVHGFRGNRYEAAQLTAQGFSLSFGEALLYPNPKLEEAFLHTPLESIFFETDTSKLPVSNIYQKAAQLRGISLKALATQLENNFYALQ